jgi:hypothetical protein
MENDLEVKWALLKNRLAGLFWLLTDWANTLEVDILLLNVKFGCTCCWLGNFALFICCAVQHHFMMVGV